MKLLCKKLLFFLVFLYIPAIASGQVKDPFKEKQATRKEAKIKQQQKRAYNKAREKGLKEHFNRQTKEVQERMKQSKKEAKKFYKGQKKDSFFKRLIRKIRKKWK